MTTTLKHAVHFTRPIFYDDSAYDMPAVCCYEITSPNGQKSFFGHYMDQASPYDSEWEAALDGEGGTTTRGYWKIYAADFTTSTPGTPMAYGKVKTLASDGGTSTTGGADNRTTDWDDTYRINIEDKQTPGVAGFPDDPSVVDSKTYLILTGDLTEEHQYTFPQASVASSLLHARGLDNANYDYEEVETNTASNFQGNPLSVEVIQRHHSGSTTTEERDRTVEYAYYGSDKYFQQKAIWDTAGRIIYKDYYDRSASAGRKGQVYRVYDPKWAGAYTNSTNKATIVPTSTANYSAQFDYDSYGRPTQVLKLQSATSVGSGYQYVETGTTYGSSGSPFWGLAETVTEDVGSGHINRLTETNSYDIAGRATETVDASGKIWTTVYDLDGLIQSVSYKPTSTSSSVPVFTYSYGDSGTANMKLTQAIDELNDVTQTISYYANTTGVAIQARGQVESITEDKGATDYSVTYEYTPGGERATALYDTPNGQSKYRYSDFVHAGSPSSPQRAFQTLTKQNYASSTWGDTDERFFYRYTSLGRMEEATFAHNVENVGGESPDYEVTHRGHTFLEADAGGRLLTYNNYWEDRNNETSSPSHSIYTSTPINDACFGYHYPYDLDLRDHTYTKEVVSGTLSTVRTEDYGYDADLDYLTSVDYNDGLTNEAVTWTYDAAGNRKSDSRYSSGGTWTYDKLNRMTASPSLDGTGPSTWAYNNDVLGNRTDRNLTTSNAGAGKYTWDVLNRMTNLYRPSVGASYYYRADGMRVEKVDGATLSWQQPSRSSGYYDTNYAENRATTRYFYDGQMPMEEDYNPSGTINKVTRNTLGGRGIDMIATTTSGGTAYAYPLYDGHGNMVATLGKSGTSYTTSSWRTYDVWGSVRSGSATGDPTKRYCANLGHQADDESDLIYMRARYYEPGSGRFVNEDPKMHGWNHFIYAGNKPTFLVDLSGEMPAYEIENILKSLLGRGLITREFFRAFMDRSTEIRAIIHDLISGFKYTTSEIEDIVLEQSLEFESEIVLETAEEIGSDVAAGIDSDLLLLMEETLIADAATGGEL